MYEVTLQEIAQSLSVRHYLESLKVFMRSLAYEVNSLSTASKHRGLVLGAIALF